MKNKKLTGLTSLYLASLIAAPAVAQIEEVMVTAQKRSESVQDVPIAVSAFTAESLMERAVTNVDGLSNLTPNVTLDGGTPFSGTSAVLAAYIRGIGSNDFAFNVDPGVGVYLDGVYLARTIGANQELMDVERIEILKGPQGTLFGRNTIGGAISIVTKEPGDELAFSTDVTFGSYDLFAIRGTIDLPLSDTLKSSLSFSSKQRDGYMERIPFPGVGNLNVEPITSFVQAGFGNAGNEEGGEDTISSRYKLVWDSSDRARSTFSADFTEIDQGQLPNSVIATTDDVFVGTYNCAIQGIGSGSCPTGGPPSEAYIPGIAGLLGIDDLASIYGVNVDADPTNDRQVFDDRFLTGNIDKTYANGNNFTRIKNWGLSFTFDYDVSDSMAFKSITAYRDLDWIVGMDLDGSPLNLQHSSFTTTQDQFSQEFQLTGSTLNDRLDYAVGVYYFVEEGTIHDYVTFGEGLLQIDGLNELKTENYAVFGQFDYRVTDATTLTLGGRFTSEDKEYEGFQRDNNGLTYKIFNSLGLDPSCSSLDPISDECRAAAGFFNPGDPLRLYIAGKQKESFSHFSPKIGLKHEFSNDVMVYASWSEGYKTGGWTTRLSNPLPFAPSFEEETAETWELGIKATLLEQTLQLNAAIFQTDYQDIQLNFQQGISPVLQNAGDADIKGAEIEVVYAPTNEFSLNVSLGVLDASYSSVDPAAQVAPNVYQTGVFDGGDLPKTPEMKFNISPRYEHSLSNGGSLVWIADYTHTAKMWNDTEGSILLERPATDIVSLSVTYTEPDDRWHFTFGGTNVTDERFVVTGQAQVAGGQINGSYNRPAEWYARLGVNF